MQINYKIDKCTGCCGSETINKVLDLIYESEDIPKPYRIKIIEKIKSELQI